MKVCETVIRYFLRPLAVRISNNSSYFITYLAVNCQIFLSFCKS